MDDDPADAKISRSISPYPPPGTAAVSELKKLEFSLFYRNEMAKLVAFLIVRGVPASRAADVAQDAMIEVYRRWDDVETPRNYVRTIAKHRWWVLVKKDNSIELSANEALESSGLLSDDHADEIESRHTLLRLLRQLTPRQREIVAWTYDGYRPTEIAALMGEPAERIRSQLRDARAILRRNEPKGGEKR